MPVPWLNAHDFGFPNIDEATGINGLVAAGGDLEPGRLLSAYRQGIFPWYEEGQPILWWSPDPRAVLYPPRVYISTSLTRLIRRKRYTVTMDDCFAAVISRCAKDRRGSHGTWITSAMRKAYCRLHDDGFAHSVEVWNGDELVGGLYGIALGQCFFGESMFSIESNTSKIALVFLVKQIHDWGYHLIDCQVSSAHLASLGAVEIPRQDFVAQVRQLVDKPGRVGKWELELEVVL
ncbi:MAG: leucyl/phenylalanyl-tRNA--protein transferase [Pseudohongiellaceae bacterium]